MAERGNRATMAALARARAQDASTPPDAWVAAHGAPVLLGEGVPVCTWCSGCQSTVYLVRMRLATGTWDVHFYCHACDRRSANHAITHDGAWVKGREVWPHKIVGALIDTLPERVNPRMSACKVCGSVEPLEQHHLAPAAVFGDDCDKWPTVMVCRSCHRHWHALMDRA